MVTYLKSSLNKKLLHLKFSFGLFDTQEINANEVKPIYQSNRIAGVVIKLLEIRNGNESSKSFWSVCY